MVMRLRKLRRERDITQKQLAEAVGVTQQAVTKWEKGKAFPRVSMLPKIAQALQCPINVLVGDVDDERRA